MKFAIIAMTAALAAVGPAQAQQPEQRPQEPRAERFDPAKRLERRVAMLTQRLDLSAEQATKIKVILTQEGEQLKAFYAKRDSAGESERRTDEQRKAMREQMQQVRERTNAEITKVLTADQLKKYEELQKQRRGHRGSRGERAAGHQS